MIKLDGMAAFAAVVEAGSITEAARRIGISKSVLSERLTELERSLGARLVQRTTRKVSAPVSFGSLHLGPALYPFLVANPKIELTLELDDRFVDVASGGFDAVIRHGPVGDNRLIVKRLASSRRMLVASPAYLARLGTPKSVADLQTRNAILYSNRETDWRFPGAGRRADIVIRPGSCLRINNGMMMRDAAIAGLGIALMPTFLVHAELARGVLRTLDMGTEAEAAEIYLAYSAGRGPSAKIHALTEHLRKAFGDPPYWETGLKKMRKAAAHIPSRK